MKNLLILLIAVVIYQNFILPKEKEVNKLEAKLSSLEFKIEEEMYLLENSRQLEKKLASVNINYSANMRYFFKEKEKESVAFTMFQKAIEDSIKDSQSTLIRSRWGDPVVLESGLKMLPIYMGVKSNSRQFVDFFHKLSQKNIIFNFDNISVNRARGKEKDSLIVTNLVLTAYQNIEIKRSR